MRTQAAIAAIAAIAVAIAVLERVRAIAASTSESARGRAVRLGSAVSPPATPLDGARTAPMGGASRPSNGGRTPALDLRPPASPPAPGTSGPPSVRAWAESSASVNPGEPFPVTVRLDARHLQRVTLNVRYDPGLLRIAAASRGDFPSASAGALSIAPGADGASFRIAFEGREVSGTGTMVILDFVLLGPQPAEIEVTTPAAHDEAGLPIGAGAGHSVGIEPNVS